MKGYKRQSNYVLQTENRGWREDETSWERADYVTGVASLAKKAQQIPERLLRTIFGSCGVTEVERKANDDGHTHVSLVKKLGIYDMGEINTGLQEDQCSPL